MTEKEKKPAAAMFTKQQFLKSANFTRTQKYVLQAVLRDDETYTLDQAKKLVENYAKRTVK